MRKNFVGPYEAEVQTHLFPDDRTDEPIEVRLYNLKCDTADTLPCVRCGVNVCEECRDYTRWPNESEFTGGRPHLPRCSQHTNIMCLCPPCDEKAEAEVKGNYLNKRCDCNLFTRWICWRCATIEEEEEEEAEYFEENTEELPDGWKH
ncbi:hypothetical protein CMUS01_06803 [Colletotrichum musicola]|uniref:Uncharacterized protein n=1 Tax=Colletotrichum musicola TaxID=2175873 RepID=A0A8H6NGH1_9PEZI|nr:hypothetical protein CMUS01_06803 [Colletotrichum musicola]